MRQEKLDNNTPTAQWEQSLVTYDHFTTQVRAENPHVIHIIAHGQRTPNGGAIAFEDDGGAPKWITGDVLAGFLYEFAKKDLKLVFLQACESALPDPFLAISSVGQFLAQCGIPAVVGMRAEIEQGLAASFAQEFYEQIKRRQPLDVAVTVARDKISNNLDAFAVPVVYLTNFGKLIDVEPSMIPSVSPSLSSLVCPRCKQWGEDIVCPGNFCQKCGLQLICLACKKPLVGALYCHTCSNCGSDIAERKDSADRAAEPPTNRTGDVLERAPSLAGG